MNSFCENAQPRLTLEEAARRIIHRQTRVSIRPGTLRAWIAQGRHAAPTERDSLFTDERKLIKMGVPHRLTESQILQLLVDRPYEFQGEATEDEEEQSEEICRLEVQLKELHRQYRYLEEMYQVLRDPYAVIPIPPDITRTGQPQLSKAQQTPYVPSYRATTPSHSLRVLPLRDHWVGRGDTHGYFALFVYLQIAHGISESAASHRRQAAKQAAKQHQRQSYPLTIVAGGANGQDDRLVVDEAQAIQNIARIHTEAQEREGSGEVPHEVICRDAVCPVCRALDQGSHRTLYNVEQEVF